MINIKNQMINTKNQMINTKNQMINTKNQMIEREFITGNYSEGKALAIYDEVKKHGDLVSFITQYMYDEADNVSRNALCSATKATNKELQSLKPILRNLIELSMNTSNSSVRRVSLSIIDRIKISEDDLYGDFLDYCLSHMIDVQEYPAIQSLCMKIAYTICKFYPELMGELLRTIDAMQLDYYSPAIKSVRRNILKEIKKKNP